MGEYVTTANVTRLLGVRSELTCIASVSYHFTPPDMDNAVSSARMKTCYVEVYKVEVERSSILTPRKTLLSNNF